MLHFPHFSTGALPIDQKFTRQRRYANELYGYGVRYNHPDIGRFIYPDTVVQNPANPQSLNRYSYCQNNPLKYVDPSGPYSYGFYTAATAAAQYQANRSVAWANGIPVILNSLRIMTISVLVPAGQS
jgi:RHS repeat-associated protein